MEGLLLSLIHASQIALETPADYEARNNRAVLFGKH